MMRLNSSFHLKCNQRSKSWATSRGILAILGTFMHPLLSAAAEAPFVAVAQIAVWEQWLEIDKHPPAQVTQRTDFMIKQSEAIVSPAIIYQVISNLNLQTTWATDSESINLEHAYGRILSMTKVMPIPDTALLSIAVTDPDQAIAISIANGIATTFVNIQIAGLSRELQQRNQTITEAVTEQEESVTDKEDQLQTLRKQLGVTAVEYSTYTGGIAKLDEALNECEVERNKLVMLRSQLAKSQIMSQLPRIPAKIIKLAEPDAIQTMEIAQ